MRLLLRYADATSAAAALDELRKNRGLLVDVEDRTLAPNTRISIVIEVGSARAEVDGVVIQALAGLGVAISFDADAPGLARLANGARGSQNSAAVVSSKWIEDPREGGASRDPLTSATRAPNAAKATDLPLRERLKTASKAEKIQLALHGNRQERNLLIRERDKSVHQYVIRNPKLGLDEVAAIARMGTVAPDVLGHIAGKREWSQRPEIAAALVRNPKVSAAVAKKLLNFVSSRELRQLAKGAGVREAIAQEARRRLFKKR